MSRTLADEQEHAAVAAFVDRWTASGGSERSNYQTFLAELCELLGVERPEPSRPDSRDNRYVFDKAVEFHHRDGTHTTGYIDLYLRGCFVLETKQGVEAAEDAVPVSAEEQARRAARRRGHGVRGSNAYATAMRKAHGQAEGYARALPTEEGRPPFVVVVDVGHSIELYSEFSRSGGAYVPYPDARSHRVLLNDLRDPAQREKLRALWLDPMSLDPSRRSAKVTREIADRLAQLAKSLEAAQHSPKAVAEFLMRCLFTMFAEDVKLLPEQAFTKLLEDAQAKPDAFKPVTEELWRTMNTGGFYGRLMTNLLRFNGGLFATPFAFDLNRDQIQLLLEAAQQNWREVEPAIFGTLLERALDPHERHKLGAHYTPRAYVERLVMPTVVEPLRDDWDAARAAATMLLAQADEKELQADEEAERIRANFKKGSAATGLSKKHDSLSSDARKLRADALKEIKKYHRQLCATRVLDPACGSGNFLYVAMEHLKRIEGEVIDFAAQLAGGQEEIESEHVTVDPHQFLGIEVNPRAATIAELVLWIGYLQWHHRTHGDVNPPEPIIRNFKNIECRDAVLAYDDVRIVLDPDTNTPVTRWDGRTTKPHPVTGQEVPDESTRIPVYEYINPRPATWPEAEYVIGNPPFIGNKRMRLVLSDSYIECLRNNYPKVPESADYVMYWWYVASQRVAEKKSNRFGLITSNSLKQVFNRRVIDTFLAAKSTPILAYAIPDHPWVDAADGAAVRVSMSVGATDAKSGILAEVVEEKRTDALEVEVTLRESAGRIHSNLTIGVDLGSATALAANALLSSRGCALVGADFLIDEVKRKKLREDLHPNLKSHIRAFLSGSDITQSSRELSVIDFFGLTSDEIRGQFPEAYQYLYDTVRIQMQAKAGRNKDADEYARLWWIFAKPRPGLRSSLATCSRFIATSEVSKHRFFVFVEYPKYLVEGGVIAIALEDAYYLATLSSRVHVTWTLAQGGTLEDRPRYNNSRCFATFPFPAPSPAQEDRIRNLGERLDAHRKARQAEHPTLTMTGMYNVLEKLRKGVALTAKEKVIHEQGLVSVLKEIHDELDAAVFEAYDWPANLSDEEILERLVALNAERAAEERQGKVRWLRPEYQCKGAAAVQLETESDEETDGTPIATAAAKKLPWPKTTPERARAVKAALAGLGGPATTEQVAAGFSNAKRNTVEELLDTLAALGQCRQLDDGRYVG